MHRQRRIDEQARPPHQQLYTKSHATTPYDACRSLLQVPFEHEPASGALRFELLRRGGEPASAPLDCTIQF